MSGQQLMRAWDILKVLIPIVVSFCALLITLGDRRPRLMLRERKGDWCTLQPTINNGRLNFAGVVEVYNVSNRANAVQSYRFWELREGGNWRLMESELYEEKLSGTDGVSHSNVTPYTLAPYSGDGIRVSAFTVFSGTPEMRIRVEVEDLFGKWYQVIVTARR